MAQAHFKDFTYIDHLVFTTTPRMLQTLTPRPKCPQFAQVLLVSSSTGKQTQQPCSAALSLAPPFPGRW